MRHIQNWLLFFSISKKDSHTRSCVELSRKMCFLSVRKNQRQTSLSLSLTRHVSLTLNTYFVVCVCSSVAITCINNYDQIWRIFIRFFFAMPFQLCITSEKFKRLVDKCFGWICLYGYTRMRLNFEISRITFFHHVKQ